MKTSLFRIAALAAALIVPVSSLQAGKSFRENLADKLKSCEYSLEVVMSKPESAIPAEGVRQAKGIILVHQYRAGFIIGGQGGSAVLLVRNPQSGKWGPPVFLDPGGVNLGFQAGVKEINSVFLLMTEAAVTKAYSGRFDAGVDAVAVAGPRNAESGNFQLFNADVYIYASYGGLYAGATLKTGWLKPYERANRELYQTRHSTPEIALSTWFEVPPEARSIYNAVLKAEKGR